MKTSDMFVVRRITEDITMINDETRRKLREMSMEEMIVALDIQNTNNSYAALPFDDRIKMLVDYVYQEKYNGKVKRLLKQARFRIPNAEAQDIHYSERGLDRELPVGGGGSGWVCRNAPSSCSPEAPAEALHDAVRL